MSWENFKEKSWDIVQYSNAFIPEAKKTIEMVTTPEYKTELERASESTDARTSEVGIDSGENSTSLFKSNYVLAVSLVAIALGFVMATKGGK